MNTARMIHTLVLAGAALWLSAGCRAPGPRAAARHCPGGSCHGVPTETAAPEGEAVLTAPASETERRYLGLPAGKASFRLADVQAEVLVVDIFDLYCHVCQKTAPTMNRLHALIQTRAQSERIRMIGIGAGDTPLETETFRKKYRIPFPAFSDRAKAVTRQLGPDQRPALVVLKRQGDRLEVVYAHTGSIDDVEATLGEILAAAGK